ncbi:MULTISPECIES: type III pantothenate kinase [Methylotenera]|uniref:type III pantothenate kinase n=1 Tax=Methylotenera TaxID=359407 RepID=UPI000366C239|nr:MULTISPECIES: type III pantothenate kinase [Methylotenera]
MLLVIDSGNTRTKWALVNSAGVMQATEVCINIDLSKSTLAQAAQKASKVLIANVAGESVAQQIAQLVAPLNTYFVVAKQQACHVINQYEQAEKLGADRWAALIAAWHITQQATLVVNAGTAITIDALVKSDQDNKAVFLGGTIMPGLRLMQTALTQNTTQLQVGEGGFSLFPTNTQDAIQTGCLNSAVGAIAVQWQQLQKYSDCSPKIIISGGDASAIFAALIAHLNVSEKQVMMAENLVLQGLAILEKETI